MPSALEVIPEHLAQFVVEQRYDLYTPIDHAAWRFIMRVSKAFFRDHAHPKYLEGLVKTGISTDRIPRISEMDECLRQFGWRAVAVSGFIPPSVFLEFEALGILAIACDMRSLAHIAYTPAPDIVHEAAGHAPIIADSEYRTYLRKYGEIARKCIFSDQDMNVYEAIRNLSEVKEDPVSTRADIESAQKRLDGALSAVDYVSEATQLSRLAWWTTEYGLVGSIKTPLIYGAGLLSSVGESYQYLDASVKKIPLAVSCIDVGYDITKPQPQLFVAESFAKLSEVVEQLAHQMAFRVGGIESLKKAKRAKTITTSQLDSELQMSGVLSDFILDSSGRVAYLQFSGPTQLSVDEKQISGHGPKTHPHGFGTPVGTVSGKKPQDLTREDLRNSGSKIRFDSGVMVEGVFVDCVQRNGRNLILSFDSCTVKFGDRVLYQPDWGRFDMGCGSEVRSVFGDAADRTEYLRAIGGHKQAPRTMKSNLTERNRQLNDLYARVRKYRDGNGSSVAELREIYSELKSVSKSDWLLRYEILELVGNSGSESSFENQLRAELSELKGLSMETASLIDRGLALLH